jgi:hypothetical protein
MDYPGKVITKTQVTPTQTSASGNWTLDDQAAAIKNNNWPVALVPNPISKSLRFNSADSAYLNRTFGSPTAQNTWTISCWLKRSALSTQQTIFSAGTSNRLEIIFASNNTLQIADASTNFIVTTPVYRDPSSWYHIVIRANGSGSAMQVYVNNVVTTNSTTNNLTTSYWNASGTVGYIGSLGGFSSNYFNGYLTEINFIDGQALDPSNFGLTNPQTGQWIPKKYTGTYGTNGFYVNFKDATSTTTLGLDYSGNANNWTTNNFSVTAGVGNDSLTDVPTPWVAYNTTGDVGGVIRGNYATLNPVWKNLYPGVYANGNLDFSTSTAKYGNAFSTIGLTSGKWYVEVLVSGTIGSAVKLGVSNQTTLNYLVGTEDDITPTTGVGYGYYLTNGNKATNGTTSAYGNSVASGDIVGIILDLDNGKIWFSKNGTVQASGDPVAGTNAAFTGITASSVWFFGGTTYTTQASFVFNFGQRPFAYTPPTGFRSLCTTNLPATAIGFGLTNQANKYFDVTTYTGDGAVRSITNSGSMQPDFVWDKLRSGANSHRLFDAVRGVEKALYSNLTNAETTETGTLTSFNSNGFSLGTNTETNTNGSTYVAWQWRASNATAVTNTAGTITSTVSANTTAGFSIVTFNIPGSGTSDTVGHGLGVAPSMVILKPRTAGTSWGVYHSGLTSAAYYLTLQTTNAQASSNSWWNSTAPTSSVFTIGATWYGTTNAVAYCFAAVPGYSAVGSYTGNGSTDGPFVYTGFRPRFIMFKVSSSAGYNWVIVDTARNIYNPQDLNLYPNLSAAEDDYTSTYPLDILSNGFKLRANYGNMNLSSGTIIYAAFAESPFQFANAR